MYTYFHHQVHVTSGKGNGTINDSVTSKNAIAVPSADVKLLSAIFLKSYAACNDGKKLGVSLHIHYNTSHKYYEISYKLQGDEIKHPGMHPGGLALVLKNSNEQIYSYASTSDSGNDPSSEATVVITAKMLQEIRTNGLTINMSEDEQKEAEKRPSYKRLFPLQRAIALRLQIAADKLNKLIMPEKADELSVMTQRKRAECCKFFSRYNGMEVSDKSVTDKAMAATFADNRKAHK